jgi:putative ABC transport system permease protein
MFLALKEMKRSKLRFVLLTAAVAVLVWLVFYIQGLTSGLITQFIGALRNQSATVLVYGEQARKNLEGSVITPDQLVNVAATVGPDAQVGRFGEGTFTVLAGGDDTDAVIIGYDLGGPGAPTTLSEGRLPQDDFEAVASSNSAGDGFDIGDTIVVVPDGQPITVVGLADDINYSVAPTMFVSWPTYVEARKIRNPDAQDVYPSAVAVIPDGGASPETTVELINTNVPGVQALTRDEAVNGSPGVSSVRSSLGGVVAIALLIVPIIASFFFVILTVQKTPSLTLLHAIGAPTRKLVGSLAIQAAIVLVGGIALALVLLLAVKAATAGASVGVAIEPRSILSTSLVVIVLSGIGLSFSIWRVLRIDPIQATNTQAVV